VRRERSDIGCGLKRLTQRNEVIELADIAEWGCANPHMLVHSHKRASDSSIPQDHHVPEEHALGVTVSINRSDAWHRNHHLVFVNDSKAPPNELGMFGKNQTLLEVRMIAEVANPQEALGPGVRAKENQATQKDAGVEKVAIHPQQFRARRIVVNVLEKQTPPRSSHGVQVSESTEPAVFNKAVRVTSATGVNA
jgi:hypothetical protein